jgi:hypothetical protein
LCNARYCSYAQFNLSELRTLPTRLQQSPRASVEVVSGVVRHRNILIGPVGTASTHLCHFSKRQLVLRDPSGDRKRNQRDVPAKRRRTLASLGLKFTNGTLSAALFFRRRGPPEIASPSPSRPSQYRSRNIGPAIPKQEQRTCSRSESPRPAIWMENLGLVSKIAQLGDPANGYSA